MNLRKYACYQVYYQQQYNLLPSQKYHLEHLLFKKLTKLLVANNYQAIGFLHTYKDDLEVYAVIDEMLKTKSHVYYSEFKNNKIIFNKITNLYADSVMKHGYLQFVNKQYLTNNLNVIVVGLQGYYEDKGLIYEEKFFKYLKNFSGKKIGYVNKNYELKPECRNLDLQIIKLDKIILI